MASQAELNILCGVVVIESVVLCQKDNPASSKTYLGLLEQVEAASCACSEYLPPCTARERQRIKGRISKFAALTFQDHLVHATVFSSFMLCALESVLSQVKGHRHRVLSDLHGRVLRLHNYYDRKLRKGADYSVASGYFDIWERIAI